MAVGDVCAADFLALLLVARVRFDAFDAGVRFLIDDTGMSSSAGSAPVMVSSASS